MEDAMLYAILGIISAICIEIFSRLRFRKIKNLFNEKKNRNIQNAEVINIRKDDKIIIGSTTYVIDAKLENNEIVQIYAETLRMYNAQEMVGMGLLFGAGFLAQNVVAQDVAKNSENKMDEELRTGSIIKVARYKGKYISMYDIKSYALTRKKCVIIELIMAAICILYSIPLLISYLV